LDNVVLAIDVTFVFVMIITCHGNIGRRRSFFFLFILDLLDRLLNLLDSSCCITTLSVRVLGFTLNLFV
jgi:hypothetical protein